jgi:replicative DNA helicase
MAEQDQLQLVQLPPQAIDVEMAVLGAMLLDEEAVAKAVERVGVDFFYKKSHKIIFNAMLELYRGEVELDLMTLNDALKSKNQLDDVGGPAYLAEISTAVASSAHVDNHLNVVKQKALSRQLIESCETILKKTYESGDSIDHLLDFAEKKIFDISEQRIKKGFESINPILHKAFERIDALHGNPNASGVTGVPTGFKDLNEMTAGWQPSDLVILAGRPSMGKTAFALNLARNAAIDNGMPVGIFSLEMSAESLALRMLCSEAKVNMMKIRNGKTTDEEMERLTKHVGVLYQAPIFIDDSPSLNVLELRAKARRIKAEHNVQLIIIDYLQLMDGLEGENRQQEMTHISRAVKGLAKELDIPVLALSQLSRAVESRDKSKRPQLSDLRESGAIEQDAYIVMFVYRPEYYGIDSWDDTNQPTYNMCEVIVGKQRNGPTGNVRLTFLKEYGKFADPDQFNDANTYGPSDFS